MESLHLQKYVCDLFGCVTGSSPLDVSVKRHSRCLSRICWHWFCWRREISLPCRHGHRTWWDKHWRPCHRCARFLSRWWRDTSTLNYRETNFFLMSPVNYNILLSFITVITVNNTQFLQRVLFSSCYPPYLLYQAWYRNDHHALVYTS